MDNSHILIKSDMKSNRTEQNKRYMDKKRKQGYKMVSYLIPVSIIEDIKQYINKKKKELIKQYEKEN